MLWYCGKCGFNGGKLGIELDEARFPVHCLCGHTETFSEAAARIARQPVSSTHCQHLEGVRETFNGRLLACGCSRIYLYPCKHFGELVTLHAIRPPNQTDTADDVRVAISDFHPEYRGRACQGCEAFKVIVPEPKKPIVSHLGVVRDWLQNRTLTDQSRTTDAATSIYECHCLACKEYREGSCQILKGEFLAQLSDLSGKCPLDHWPRPYKSEWHPSGNWHRSFELTKDDELPEFITSQQLTADTLALASELPPDITRIIGVARSGLIPASLLAATLHLPLTVLRHHQAECVDAGNGWRLQGQQEKNGRILVVDDTTMSGNSLRRTRYYLQNIPGEKVYAAIYVNPHAMVKPDVWVHDLKWPHLLEWNLFNSVIVDSVALDFDGILCHDCPVEDDDDGSRYAKWLADVKPLYPARFKPIKLIVTARLEKYRQQTLAWMEKWGIRCDKLVMGPWATKQERTLPKVIELKAEHFQQFAKAGTGKNYSRFFIESDPRQAEAISDLSGQLVVCPKRGGCFKPRTKSKPPVWIIGFPRCGTSSLCKALDILGWDTIHNPRHWDDLEGYNAAGDVFVTAHWRDLLQMYPDGKFILNTRPFGEWVNSIRVMTGFWESANPFDAYYRQQVYGTHNPHDTATLRQTWLAHHAEVRSTIPPEQLLEMPLPFEWNQLCRFLGHPIPNVPFPHLNQQTSEFAGYKSKQGVHWLK